MVSKTNFREKWGLLAGGSFISRLYFKPSQ